MVAPARKARKQVSGRDGTGGAFDALRTGRLSSETVPETRIPISFAASVDAPRRKAKSRMSQNAVTDKSAATELLFLRDSYLRRFEATVVASDNESRTVTLDRTAFYAGGGGQPCDTGAISAADGARSWPVVAVRKEGAVARHAIGGSDSLPEAGERVTGEIDWEPRYRLMRMHTALHALCGTIFRDYGALVTGGNMGTDKARMDFEMEEFTPERVAEIERRVNEELAKERDVRVQILPREVAFTIPDLIRTKINLIPEGITEVRTVEIAGLDLQADGGTHVANTREVGGIKVIGTRSKGKSNKRLEIVLTGMAEDEEHEAAARAGG
jgi:misacylated tRNA(Ala) deacylase